LDRPLFTLRPATSADQAEIKALIKAVRINPLGLGWRRFVVAEDENGRFIACGQIKPHRDGSRELASLAVRPEWRKRGVASAIIHHLLTPYTGKQAIWLTCVSRLAPFYQQFGFQEIANPQEMPPYFSRVYRLYNLFTRLSKQSDYLAVMVRSAESAG
jgi:N-acetylglutamate synthase-like GNAT family acetyltransferase